jgi:Phage integrase family
MSRVCCLEPPAGIQQAVLFFGRSRGGHDTPHPLRRDCNRCPQPAARAEQGTHGAAPARTAGAARGEAVGCGGCLIDTDEETDGRPAPNTVSSLVRTREYLTGREIEHLMAAARKGSRWGHRDATMILIGYRHGLRAQELCSLRWSQIDLRHGRLHVNRAKGGIESVHPLHGPELRALRPLQGRSCPCSKSPQG